MRIAFSPLAAAAAVAMMGAAPPVFSNQTRLAPVPPAVVMAEKARSRARTLRERATRQPTRYDEERLRLAKLKRERKAAKRARDFAASQAGYYFARAA